MNSLFYYTGAILWVSLAVIVLFALAYIAFEMLGATIFWIRVLRAGDRAKLDVSYQEKLGLWESILVQHGRGTWTIDKSGEKVKYPRPWYRESDDRNEYIPG